MDNLSNYRITAATSREEDLARIAERVRVARERLRTADEIAELEGAYARPSWIARLTGRVARTSTPSHSRFDATAPVPCAPAAR